MAKYGAFSVDGEPLAYYDDDIHDPIPDGAVALTDEQWEELVGHHGLRRYIEGDVVAIAPPPPPPPPLTRRQLRLGLLANGITTAQVEAVISDIPNEIDRETAQIEWADASTYERSHPLVDQIGAAMSLTPAQIDDMWIEAAAL